MPVWLNKRPLGKRLSVPGHSDRVNQHAKKGDAGIMKKNRIYITLMVVVLAMVIALPLGAGAKTIKIQAMRLGSSWYVFGATLATMLKENLPVETR